MAQIEKYNMRQAIAIIAHCERTGGYHSNKNIDPERTQDDYSLWPADDPDELVLDTEVPGQSSARYAYRRMKQRLSEVSCLDRNDVNVLCDWCIHLGVDTLPGYENQRQFFEACVEYICDLYGKENVVYAWVHMDEETPHIHVGFVPVVKKPLKLRKNASAATKQAYEDAVAAGQTHVDRVDADSVITRKHLQDWHPGFQAAMIDQLGYDPGVHTGVTQYLGGNMSVGQLKNKPRNWRQKRNRAAEAYHETRRAAKSGRRAGLDAVITASDPESSRMQSQERPGKEQKGVSLADLMQEAREQGGNDGW